MNETKNKMMKIGKNVEENGVNITLNDRRMEEVETYRYFRVEVNHRITEAKKAWGALKDLWKIGLISRKAKLGM